MSDYTKSTNFASKDSLAVGNPLKIVKGTEIDAEFNNIATAVATKADLASPTFTGSPLAPTAAVDTNTTQVATTAFVIAQIADDAPTKTGTGASGNWPINVTGSAGTVTTLTTSQVLNATSGAAASDVGTYMYVRFQITTSSVVAAGTNISGSSLQPACFCYDSFFGNAWFGSGQGSVLPGTWKLMSSIPNTGTSYSIIALVLRVA